VSPQHPCSSCLNSDPLIKTSYAVRRLSITHI